MRKWLSIAGFTLLHLFMSAVSIANSFSLGMARFDTGAPMTAREHAWNTLADLLLCPLIPLSRSLNLPLGRLENLLMLANSILWGIILYWVTSLLFRRKAAVPVSDRVH